MKPIITTKLLDSFPYERYASNAIVQRGRQYFRSERVYEIEFDGDSAHCQIDGSSDDYEVEIHLQEDEIMKPLHSQLHV